MVSLRFAALTDADFILEVRNDPTTVVQLHDNRIFSVDEFNKWFEITKPNWFIILSDEMECGYVRTKWIEDNVLQIGVDIHPDFRRRGIATETYHKIFETYHWVDKFQLEVLDTNFVAIALYTKLGFKEISRYTFCDYTKCSIIMEKPNA